MANILSLSSATRHPIRNGDSLRVFGLMEGLRLHGHHCHSVGNNFIESNNGEIKPLGSTSNRSGKYPAIILAWLKRQHYLEIRHCPRRWMQRAITSIKDNSCEIVYCHFLYTFRSIRNALGEKKLVIDTHNSEWNWYQLLRDSTRNPIARSVCDISIRRASEMMKILPADTLMVHVSDSDAADYRRYRPDIEHMVVPNGSNAFPRLDFPNYRDPRKKLLFVGSLGQKMNLDALLHFHQTFWPKLQDVCSVVVAGSNPSSSMRKLIIAAGWELRENLSDLGLARAFEEAHFSILPFQYGAGSKLKFFEAIAKGVPILSTIAGACGQKSPPAFSVVSDDPNIWRKAIISQQSLPDEWRQISEEWAIDYRWKNLTEPLAKRLHTMVIKS